MSILSSMKQSIKAGLIAALVIGSGAFALNSSASALSISGPQDCDLNSVIYCGAQSSESLISKYNNGTEKNTAKSIHDIYAKFGISSAEVNAMNSTAVLGKVTDTNEVIVGTKVVAKNALTAGRENISGSTAVSYNGTSFYTRAPSVSFRNASIPAYVVMKNGVFQYAIIESCANPVTATPTTTPPPVTPPPALTPAYTIVKSVAVKGSSDYQDSIANLKPGTHVTYQVIVKSTGKAAVKNLTVKDVLPAHVTYVANTLTRDSAAVAGVGFFGTGVNVASLAAGTTTTFQFEAVIGTETIGTVCKNETLTNTGTISATSLPTTSDTATVSTVCAPVVIETAPTCNNFEIVPSANRTITVSKFDYTTNKYTFVSAVINWDLGKTNVSSPAITNAASVVGQTHQYAADGKYLVAVTVNFSLDGKTVSATGVQCEKEVTFSTAPPVVVTPPAAPVAHVTALVNTGAGSTAALFGGASIVAFAAYQWSLRRRLSL